MFLRRKRGVKLATSYQVVVYESSVNLKKILALQYVKAHFTKVTNMPIHRWPHLASNVRCKPQRHHKNKKPFIQLANWLKKWFERWNAQDLSKLSIDAMQYVIIISTTEEILYRLKWKCKPYMLGFNKR